MRRWVPIVGGLLVLVAGVAIYSRSFGGPFIFDDVPSIPDNPSIRALWPPTYLIDPPPQSTVVSRPLVSATLALNYAVSGKEVWSYHAVNLAIHLVCALLLAGVTRRTLRLPSMPRALRESSDLFAIATAILWVSHPLQTESVAYVILRTETLMALFFLVTLYAAIRAWTADDERVATRWQVLGVFACALGMASKEVMVAAPLVVLLYDRSFVSGSFRDALGRHRAFYVGLGSTLLIAVVLVATGDRGASAGFHHGIGPWSYLLTQSGVILWYLRLSFWPDSLSISYEDWPMASGVGEVIGPGLVLLGLLAVTLWALIRRPRLGFLGAFFFLVLAPTSSILPIATEPAGERRMYLPLAAVIILVLLALAWAASRLRPVGSLLLGLLGVGAVLASGITTAHRVTQFRTATAIWQDCVDKRPRNAAAHTNLGQALIRDGRIEAAADHFERAIELDPAAPEAYSNLAGLMNRNGRTDRAIELLERALELNPDRPAEIHNNLGIVFAQTGRIERAEGHFREAIRDGAYAPDAHFNLGLLHAWRGDLAAASDELGRAFELDPGREEVAVALGDALCRAGRSEQAGKLVSRLRSRGNHVAADTIAKRCGTSAMMPGP